MIWRMRVTSPMIASGTERVRTHKTGSTLFHTAFAPAYRALLRHRRGAKSTAGAPVRAADSIFEKFRMSLMMAARFALVRMVSTNRADRAELFLQKQAGHGDERRSWEWNLVVMLARNSALAGRFPRGDARFFQLLVVVR